MSNRTPNRRKTLLINPKFQISFLTAVLGVALVTLGVFYAAKVIFFQGVNSYVTSVGLPKDHLVFDFLKSQSRVMDYIFLGAALIELCFLAIFGLVLSHRVAGPLYRLYQHMNGIANGEPVRNVQFRQGDYFVELAEAYNKQLERTQKERG